MAKGNGEGFTGGVTVGYIVRDAEIAEEGEYIGDAAEVGYMGDVEFEHGRR